MNVDEVARDALRGGGDAPGRWVEVLGRGGLVAYGAVHMILAALIVRIIAGVRGLPADQGGVIAVVAAQGLVGRLLLVAAMVGLLAFTLWQVWAAARGFRWVEGSERVRKRVGAAAKAVALVAVVTVIAPAVLGERPTNGNAAARTLTASLLGLPGGRFIVVVVALVVLVVAISMIYTGVRATFLGDLWPDLLPRPLKITATVLGGAGNLARAAALGGVGWAFTRAALTDRANRSEGLDGALVALGRTTFGSVILVLIAAGVAAFGVYCFIDAYARRA